MGKEEWKETGKSMGNAFSSLGKNIIRSAKTTVDKATDWAEKDENKSSKENVFNDGSWRETGKEMGHAFGSFGKNVFKSTKDGVNKATDWAEEKKEKREAAASVEKNPPKDAVDATEDVENVETAE